MTRSPADPAAPAAAAPPAPAAATTLFGPRVGLAERYAELLAGHATARGLIGPREVERLWDRHILNCAVLAELVPTTADVADVGSGAGLPGIPIAIARADVRMVLIEPMQRRAAFLREVIDALELDGVTVLHARGEDAPRAAFDVVTARAVAPLARLVPMLAPLSRAGGVVVAVKGTSAGAEVIAAERDITAAGGSAAEIVRLGTGVIEPPTIAVVVRMLRSRPPTRGTRARSRE